MRRLRRAGTLDRTLFGTMRVLESTSLFLFFFSLSVVGLYGIGNFQGFLDESQLMLLGVLRVVASLSAFAGLYYLILLIIWMIRRRIRIVPRVVYALVATAVSATFVVAVTLLEAVVVG